MGAVALGFPKREAYVTLKENVSIGRWPSDSLGREVIYVTLRSTLRGGRQPSDSLRGRSFT